MKKEFKRLIKDYSEFYWVSAWADGQDFPIFRKLRDNQSKIVKIIIGTSFKRTDPRFIEEFMKVKHVRFDKHNDGVFHPKAYLFAKEDKWELIIGSANFTRGSFGTNRELSLLINGAEEADADLRDLVIDEIEKYWKKSDYFTKEEFVEYAAAHKKIVETQSQIVSASFQKVDKSTSWDRYVRLIISGHLFDDRMLLLRSVGGSFESNKHFKDMDYDTRRQIAGYVTGNKGRIDWRMFGNTREPGDFSHKVKDEAEKISAALDEVPLRGEIYKSHYDAFVREFRPMFPKSMIMHASRILTMKRPDVFFCITGRNSHRFFRCYPTRSYRADNESYWKEVISKIHSSVWWQSPEPATQVEKEIWLNRAALLDTIYYDPPME